jgi:hypothetical protein
MIPFWGECLRVLLAIQMSRIENLGMSNTSVWPVSPCKVRPCGLLCRRALFCEWWPWMPFLGTRFGGGVFLSLRPNLLSRWFHSFCVFLLSQTDCRRMEGYGFWTSAAGMIFHRVQRGDLAFFKVVEN